jgi:hypothetical protein
MFKIVITFFTTRILDENIDFFFNLVLFTHTLTLIGALIINEN